MAPDHTTNGIHSTNYSKTCHTSKLKTDGWVLPSAAVKSTSPFLTWRPIGVFLFNCLDSCLFSQATTASPGFFFFFFTWESQTTSGPMLGYRPNNCTTELLIQRLSNASMRVSSGYRWQKNVMTYLCLQKRS